MSNTITLAAVNGHIDAMINGQRIKMTRAAASILLTSLEEILIQGYTYTEHNTP